MTGSKAFFSVKLNKKIEKSRRVLIFLTESIMLRWWKVGQSGGKG
jgi:hypothetical protein